MVYMRINSQPLPSPKGETGAGGAVYHTGSAHIRDWTFVRIH